MVLESKCNLHYHRFAAPLSLGIDQKKNVVKTPTPTPTAGILHEHVKNQSFLNSQYLVCGTHIPHKALSNLFIKSETHSWRANPPPYKTDEYLTRMLPVLDLYFHMVSDPILYVLSP